MFIHCFQSITIKNKVSSLFTKFTKSILFIILYLLFTMSVSAQTCSQDFTVNVITTPSTCQANGTVTVTLTGNTANLFNIEYGLSGGGTTIVPQPNNAMTNIPPGTYQLTVRAFCSVDAAYDVVKTVSNVTVNGNYQVPLATFSTNYSRPSYDVCNTGTIVLDVSRGYGGFTFKITAAPVGVTVPQTVTATNAGTLYTLAGLYPAGAYTVEVSDNCYTASVPFNLGQISGFPNFTYAPGNFTPAVPYTCSDISWSLGASWDFPQYQSHILAGLYEVAVSIAGDTTGWFEWTGNSIVMNISPYEYSDLYNDNSFDVHLRLKTCPGTMQTYSTKIQQPSNPFWAGVGIKERRCDGYTMGFMPWWSEMFCFPFDVEIKDVAADTVVWSATDLYWDDRDYVTSPLLKYGLNYSWISHDAKGLLLGSGNFNQTNNQGVDIKNEIRCDSATYTFSFPETTCFPVDVLVFWTYAYATPRDTILRLYNVTQSGYLPENTFTVSSTDYGWWRVEGINNSLPSPFTAAGLVEPSSGRATSYNLYMPYNMNVCKPGYGLLRVGGNTFSPVDSIYFDIEGPPGYTPQSMAFDGGGQSWDFPETLLPAGEYTLTVRLTCGAPLISKYTITEQQIFGRTELDYYSSWDCNGLTVFPTGRITAGGKDTTTYYRMVAYPSGLSFSDITPGGSFLLTKPGIYSMIMHYQGENCWGETIYKEINYQPQPLQLNPSLSSAYVCDGGGLGNITIAAQNGKPPYRYELWDAAGTTYLNFWDEKTDDSPVYFNYGAVGDVFTVKFSDACGSQFSQQITMLDLATASISYALNLGEVCEDDEIQLYCMTLGITSYSWKGPGSWTSNEQNPGRANASPAMSGWYVVTVQPEHCGISKKDSVYITVNPKSAAPNVLHTSLSYCKNFVAPALLTASEATALALYTLKWYTFDGVNVYTPITPPNPISTSAAGSWDYYVSQVNNTTGCESNKVHITVTVIDSPQSLYNYPDIRADVCSDIASLNLCKYLDVTTLSSVSWDKISGANITADGYVTTSGLSDMHIHTYKYTVTNPCGSNIVRKFYLQTINNNTVRPLRDTIIVCWEKAEALQLNQIFGIDAGGDWIYDAALTGHVTEISVLPYIGALIFNGKTAYSDMLNIPYDTGYPVPNSKTIVFKYKSDMSSCLGGKEYRIVIVLIN